MKALRIRSRRSLMTIIGATVVVPLGVVALVAAEGGVASATTAGSLGVTGGSLSVTPPSTLTWSATLAGLDQAAVDGVVGDQSFNVTDATGSGAGWNVNTKATTFTCTSAAAAGTCQPSTGTFNEQYLPQTFNGNGIFWVNGSTSSSSSTSGPATPCATHSTCTAPTNSVTYPAFVTPGAAGAAGSTSKILNAAAQTGLGSFDVNTVGWWLEVPANTYAGTYTSTITVAINTGP